MSLHCSRVLAKYSKEAMTSRMINDSGGLVYVLNLVLSLGTIWIPVPKKRKIVYGQVVKDLDYIQRQLTEAHDLAKKYEPPFIARETGSQLTLATMLLLYIKGVSEADLREANKLTTYILGTLYYY